ncbi:MAG: hypothetical protein ACLPKW_02185 [Acetobacteraceae bacterium]
MVQHRAHPGARWRQGHIVSPALSRHRRDAAIYRALYHLASSEVPYSSEWKAAANTKWTERMRPHFRDHLRFECQRYTRAD